MALTLYSLLEALLLVINAIAILNKDRFLKKVGLTATPDYDVYGGTTEPTVKHQIVNLIYSVQTVMRMPLIAVNAVVIVFKLVFG